MPGATSRWMTAWPPMSPASGPWATATAAEPSPTRAYNDYEIVAANLLDGANRRVSDRIPGYALYIDPPLGRVGLSETEAIKSGRKLLVSKRPMTRVGRAIEKGETKGFMKVVADAETKQILGAAILGVSGDEAIHGVLDMMNAGAAYPVLQWAVPIHPTVSELIPTVLGDLRPVEAGGAQPFHHRTYGDRSKQLGPRRALVLSPHRARRPRILGISDQRISPCDLMSFQGPSSPIMS